MDTGDLKSLPLDDVHRAAGAKFGAFAGWSMPLSYPLGVMKEHLHTRRSAGLFDISHMRLFSVSGVDAATFLAKACPIEPGAISLGHSKYTLLLDEKAGILDDLIVTRLSPRRFMIVANAGNAQGDQAHLEAIANDFDVTLEAHDRVFLALQGPNAESVLRGVDLGVLPSAFMRAGEPHADCFVSRSGFTGEDGFEIALRAQEARRVVAALLDDPRVAWAGLAARDSLRLEAGLCLHGQDITTDIDPVAAGLLWAIPSFTREAGAFVGAEALRSLIKAGPRERRVGLKPEGRQPVRAGAPLRLEDGTPVGGVNSGGFGPSVDHPVAMGYVRADLARPGTRLVAEVRGSRVPVTTHSLPFVSHNHVRGSA